ncbi:flagellar filament capping protein FliD [Dissulfurispira sp.]|uniref:flagellar filament capping protein FliD n=1 Tax=Dissulfurispira sp. TaxID=2817609 RepID=UPI002FDAFFA7
MAVNPLGSSGSSIDTNAIVQQLMQVERQPLLKLKQKEANYQAKISAYATLLSSVSSFKSAVTALKDSSLIRMKATVSDTSYMTATASSTATAGTYTMKIGSLATAQSLSSLRFGSQTMKVADLSVNTTQKIKIQVGSSTAKEITIDSTNNTLSGIKDAINSASAGVTASIVKESSSFVIDANNNTIVFNDGTADRTATIAEGTYTSSGLATAIQTALNSAPGTTNTFSVEYDTTLSKFKITNSAGPDVNILWGNASTTAEQILGFDPTTDTVTAGSSTIGDDTVDGTYKLTLTSSTTGASNTISLTVDENNDGTYGGADETDTVGLSSLASGNMSTTQAAADASITVNGLTVTRSSNTVTDVITGVTMNLVKISGATEFTLTVAQDTGTLTSKLNFFVSSYNQVMSTINDLRGNATTRGILSGDATSAALKNTLRTIITATYNNTNLVSLGLTHDKNGVLSLNSTTLNSAISSNQSSVITTINTMATSLEASLGNYVNTILPARKDGYQETVKNVRKNAENLERRLQTTEVALKEKFIALDRLLNQLQGTSSYLTQQMNKLGKTFGGK